MSLHRAGFVVVFTWIGAGCAEAPSAAAEPIAIEARPEAPVAAPGVGTGSPVVEAAPSDAGIADASADAAAAPPPPAIFDDPPSAEKSKAPTKKEWASAPAVRLARVTYDNCSAKRIREWVRVACKAYYHSLSVVSGTREGLDIGILTESDNLGYVIFPVRKGDSRLIMLQRMSKWSGFPDALISEQWLENDKGPLISIVGL
jgi:hypothetical protein